MKTREIPYNFSLRSRPVCHDAGPLRRAPAPNTNGLSGAHFKCPFKSCMLLLIVLLTKIDVFWSEYRTNQCVLLFFDLNGHMVES